MTSQRAWSVGTLACAALVVATVAGAPAQTRTFAQAGIIPGPLELVRTDGSLVYVASDKKLGIFDVTNPAAPKRLAEYVFPEQIWGFRVADRRVFVAAGHSGLGILDVSNPSAPRLVTQFKTPGQAKNVSIASNKAFVADHLSGIDVIDLSDASKPTLLGSAYVDGYARDVAAAGRVAVAVDNPTGVYVFDAATKAVDPISSLQSARAPQQVELANLPGAPGRTLAILAGSEPYDPLRAVRLQAGAKPRGGVIQVVDVTNPAAPVMAGAYPTASGGRRVAAKGSLVYLANGADGLEVLDVSAPSKPTRIATFKTAKPVRDVAVGESLVFLVVGGPASSVVGGQPGDGDDSELLILRQLP